jgi:hypothetical protein
MIQIRYHKEKVIIELISNFLRSPQRQKHIYFLEKEEIHFQYINRSTCYSFDDGFDSNHVLNVEKKEKNQISLF